MSKKMTSEQRTKIIAWLVMHRDEVKNKTSKQIVALIRADLGFDLLRTSTETIKKFAAELGIELAPGRVSPGQLTKNAESGKPNEAIIALARVLLALVRELGVEPHPDLLRIAGRAPSVVKPSPDVAEPVNVSRNGNGELFGPEVST